jgi:predicted dinucleotide-binding enzyme
MNTTKKLNIGILGVGHIGKTLARKLSAVGHGVKVANSRGPETIGADVLTFGAPCYCTDLSQEKLPAALTAPRISMRNISFA